MELRFQWEQAEEQLRRQCQEQRVCSQQELQQVQEEQAKLQQDFNKRLLQAESEKQQVCLSLCVWVMINDLFLGLKTYDNYND